MAVNGSFPGTIKDCEDHGENLNWDNWLSFMYYKEGPVSRWFMNGFLSKILGKKR